jgi:hypothetical protein
MNLKFAKAAFSLLLVGGLVDAFAQEPDQVTAADLAGAHPHTMARAAQAKPSGSAGTNAATASTIPGIDTITTFNGHFSTPGFDPSGNPNTHWYYTMVGQSPDDGGTTRFSAPVIAVSIDLRNFDGSPRFVNGQRLYYDGTQYLAPVLNSPVFQKFRYDSSERPTQYADAIQRAEFGEQAEDEWHNLLVPHVRTPRVMTLIRGTYRFALNPDGSCCSFVLVDLNTFINLLFPPTFPFDNSTVIGAAELAGDITTQDISTFLFPNTYLYFNGDPTQCCVLGFHTLDVEPGVPSNGNRLRFYVVNYSSWISPGLFGDAFVDVTALSHEISETFNDPLVAYDGVHGITPWWLSPNGNCQDNLEVGDVIEGLPNATFPITMNGLTYHPQNEALLPWFEFKRHPRSIHGAYSYPDTTVLTALSPVEKANCQ